MININEVCLVLSTLFQTLGWRPPKDEDYMLLNDVIEDLSNCSDDNSYIDQEVKALQEQLYLEFLEETEYGYDERGRAVIDLAVDLFETNS